MTPRSTATRPGQNLTSIGGASVAENTYLVNGLNITNFRNGLGGSNVPFEFVEEVQVKTGGYEAEFGRSTGGVLNMVTKSGSNNLHGGVSAYFQPESLQETVAELLQRLQPGGETSRAPRPTSRSAARSSKDRAFFFGFYQVNDIESSSVGLTRETRASRDDPYFGGKLDLNITPSQRIEATYFTDEVDVNRSTAGITSFDDRHPHPRRSIGSGTYDAGGNNTIAKYTGIFGSNFVLSAQSGNNEFNRTTAVGRRRFPYILDNRGDSTLASGNWVNWQAGEADDEREALRVDLDYFVGASQPPCRSRRRDQHLERPDLLLGSRVLPLLHQRPRPASRRCARTPSSCASACSRAAVSSRRSRTPSTSRIPGRSTTAAAPQRRRPPRGVRQQERAGRELHQERRPVRSA